MGPPGSTVCQQHLNTFTCICADLGVPLAADKLEGPSTSLCFLVIILDTEHMEIRLPADKLVRIKQLLISWLPRKKVRKRQILSLVGTLHHATKVVGPGRAFVARMYSTAAKLRKMHFVTRLNTSFRSVMVAYFPSGLEWFQYSQTSCSIASSGLDPNWRFRSMGLCSSDEFTLAAVAMAFRMVQYWNHG